MTHKGNVPDAGTVIAMRKAIQQSPAAAPARATPLSLRARTSTESQAVSSGAYFGNQTMLRRLSRTPPQVQCKLPIGAVNDPLEAEADRVADHVMRMPESNGLAAPNSISGKPPFMQRKCSCSESGGECEACKKEHEKNSPEEGLLHRATSGVVHAQGAAPPLVHKVLRSSGQPLDAGTRAFFEPRFGYDFGNVRVHTDGEAAKSARAVSALAYTVGNHIVFRDERPEAIESRRLVAHELAHVAQQTAAPAEAGFLPLQESEGPVSVLQRDPDPRGQEADRAATEMWGIVNDINDVGAEVEFLYFTSNGAMTLTSYKQTKGGSGTAGSISLDSFKKDTLGFAGGVASGSSLTTFVGTSERYFKLTLRREPRKWSVQSWGEDKATGQPTTPPEGRTQPNMANPGVPVDIFARVTDAVKKWLPVLRAYPGGTSTAKMTAEFDDDRLTKLDLKQQNFNGGKGPSFAQAAFGTDIALTNTLLGFTQGLGKRTLNLSLEGDASAKTTETQWRVKEVAPDRGPAAPMPDEAAAIVADYRHMHAEIIRKWREGVKDAAVYAGMLGVEQLAYWMIGGVLARGLGVVAEAVAPRLINFIRLGSSGASRAGAEYLETMIARLPSAERAEMQALARKTETEGVEALGSAEKKSLESLLKKIESLVDAPLSTAEKETLRGRMVARFGAAKPGVDAAFQTAQRAYQIHHRVPLEYGHLFPGFDVNAGRNLIGLETEVHRGVNAVWTRLRSTASGKITSNVVSKVMDIIDKNFGKWYDLVPGSTGAALEAEVAAAKSAAYDAVAALVNKL